MVTACQQMSRSSNYEVNSRWLQLVKEQKACEFALSPFHNPKVAGSIPASATNPLGVSIPYQATADQTLSLIENICRDSVGKGTNFFKICPGSNADSSE